jgi:ABC-type multidrug transport system fused ATPase/permease subunit
MEKAVANRFQVPALKRFLADRKAVLGLTIFRGAILYVAGMALLGACWYGRRMVRDEKSLQAGDLVAFLVYAVQIAVSMANSTRGLAVISIGMGCAKSTFKLLDEEENHHSLETELAMQLSTHNNPQLDKPCEVIRFDNVSFGYPTEGRSSTVLRSINLTLKRGKSIALVGPSGAGKSSVIALLEKFYSPTEGRILVDNVDLLNLSTRAWRNKIGLVTQDACLFAGSIAENIALGKPDAPAPTKHDIQRAAEIANVIEFSKDLPLGLETQVGIRGSHLSSGQRQRVAVARAIIRDPHVLLLDEHTSQLDTQSERLVQDSMDDLMKGRISLVIAHRLQTARRAHEICVLSSGKVVEMGTHDQLVTKPGGAYHGLWLAQQAKQE